MRRWARRASTACGAGWQDLGWLAALLLVALYVILWDSGICPRTRRRRDASPTP